MSTYDLSVAELSPEQRALALVEAARDQYTRLNEHWTCGDGNMQGRLNAYLILDFLVGGKPSLKGPFLYDDALVNRRISTFDPNDEFRCVEVFRKAGGLPGFSFMPEVFKARNFRNKTDELGLPLERNGLVTIEGTADGTAAISGLPVREVS